MCLKPIHHEIEEAGFGCARGELDRGTLFAGEADVELTPAGALVLEGQFDGGKGARGEELDLSGSFGNATVEPGLKSEYFHPDSFGSRPEARKRDPIGHRLPVHPDTQAPGKHAHEAVFGGLEFRVVHVEQRPRHRFRLEGRIHAEGEGVEIELQRCVEVARRVDVQARGGAREGVGEDGRARHEGHEGHPGGDSGESPPSH